MRLLNLLIFITFPVMYTKRIFTKIKNYEQPNCINCKHYITENYNREDQKYLIDEMSRNLIDFRRQEIEDKIIELEKNEAELVSLNENLEELLIK